MRWGILGTGWIAHDFATALQTMPDAELVAVGSRTQNKADAFAKEFSVPRAHGSYAELAADTEVDIIHIATPHTLHKTHAMLCISEGKAVLCEKPFTLNATEAAELIAFARERQALLIEALWPRFLPAYQKIRELLQSSAIGEVQMLTANFPTKKAFEPDNRYFSLALGGGALLDVGVYCLALTSMVMGEPEQISAFAHIGDTGVDEYAAIQLQYPQGRLASVTTSFNTRAPRDAFILGSEGYIKIHSVFSNPDQLTLARRDEAEQLIDVSYPGRWGFVYEIREAMRCLQAGLLESELMPLDESLALMRTMDDIRAQWGLYYPGE